MAKSNNPIKPGEIYTLNGRRGRFRWSWARGEWIPEPVYRRKRKKGFLANQDNVDFERLRNEGLPRNPERFRGGRQLMEERTKQFKARCQTCNHTFPLHRNGNDRCHNRGCRCETWVSDEETYQSPDYVYDPNFSKAEYMKAKYPHRFDKSLDLYQEPEDVPGS